jgi:predicted RNase H-like HicB family nuclease
MTAGQGLEYYIAATDERGQSTSQGFVGFPLAVQLVAGQGLTQEERLKALQETLDVIRKDKEKEGLPQKTDQPSKRYR